MTRSEYDASEEDAAAVAAENQTTAAGAAGPRECCLDANNRTPLEEYGPGRFRYRCDICEREFFLTRMYFDDTCIEPMDYELWRSAAPGESPGDVELSEYIMNRKPYYARNIAAAGSFQRVD
ncbi:MAG: hypothetical protein NXI24_06830 [bacterium]|nr:hypothetical protein [bacterium]